MDRYDWMYQIPRATKEYLTCLDHFMEVVENNRVNNGETEIWCPCRDCRNFCKYSDHILIKEHLIVRGFMERYTCWIRHGEDFDNCNYTVDRDCNDTNDNYESDNDNRDNLDEMLHDVEDNIADKDYDKFEQLFIDSEKPLYVGCSKFTKLSAVLRLFNLKASNGWSDKSFTTLLEILHEMLPEDNELPVSLYQAKKLMCPMGLEIERIHACPNDCMLYRNADAGLKECRICGTPRYKRNQTKENNFHGGSSFTGECTTFLDPTILGCNLNFRPQFTLNRGKKHNWRVHHYLCKNNRLLGVEKSILRMPYKFKNKPYSNV